MTWAKINLRAAALSVVLSSAACGVGSTSQTGATGAAASVTVTLDPIAVELEPDGEIAFGATVSGTSETGVTWAVVEGATGGAVASGRYKAPASEGDYHVVATSVADPTKSATAAVRARRARISVSPSSLAVNGCQAATFTAKINGSASSAVTWSVREGSAGGAITAAGAYTAPAAAGTFHVVATSRTDATRVATATVAVTTKVLSVTVNPASLAVAAGRTSKLSATVVTTCGSFASP